MPPAAALLAHRRRISRDRHQVPAHTGAGAERLSIVIGMSNPGTIPAA
jgi:hypothetical protein